VVTFPSGNLSQCHGMFESNVETVANRIGHKAPRNVGRHTEIESCLDGQIGSMVLKRIESLLLRNRNVDC